MTCWWIEPHAAHGECAGLTDWKRHTFDARQGYEEYIRCCPFAVGHEVHTVPVPQPTNYLMRTERPLPGLPPVRTAVVPCVWCGVIGNHDPICREAS